MTIQLHNLIPCRSCNVIADILVQHDKCLFKKRKKEEEEESTYYIGRKD